MEHAGGTLRLIALIGAIVVGGIAAFALYQDRKAPGLDNNVTKLLLGLMVFGCVLVVLAATHVMGGAG